MAWQFEKVAGPCKGRTGGLCWDGSGMLFSAVAEERVLRYDPATDETTVFRRWTGRVNGLARDPGGALYAAQEGGRRIVRFNPDGSTSPVLDLLDGAHHNQPVDVSRDRSGRIWFADPWNAQPPYGPPAYPLLPHASVLRLDPTGPDRWRMVRFTHDTAGPRAIALSSDERTLYVADGDAERGDVCQLFAYPVSSYGSAGPRHTLLTFTAADRGIEGLCVDSEGCLIACMGWARGGAGPAIVVISPSGTILETHASPADMPMRCAFGDVGLSTLYVTAADGGLYRCRGTGRRGLARP
ncbi:MAG: SMP-30/gluconolactonase/LRE family protein [Pseudomonadota bacterium]|jgi:gluconolactonase